jgi:predicted metal-dependent peptidase
VLSWSRPSRSYIAHQGRIGTRRMPMEPGLQLQPDPPRLVVVLDVSGSIDADALARFGREVEALRRRHGAGLVLVAGDDRVREVRTLAPGRSAFDGLECHGGGGTDFTPLLDEAMRHRPDLVVVLTDLDGPARTRPACPVLWAVPDAHRDARAPFGRKLVID